MPRKIMALFAWDFDVVQPCGQTVTSTSRSSPPEIKAQIRSFYTFKYISALCLTENGPDYVLWQVRPFEGCLSHLCENTFKCSRVHKICDVIMFRRICAEFVELMNLVTALSQNPRFLGCSASILRTDREVSGSTEFALVSTQMKIYESLSTAQGVREIKKIYHSHSPREWMRG